MPLTHFAPSHTPSKPPHLSHSQSRQSLIKPAKTPASSTPSLAIHPFFTSLTLQSPFTPPLGTPVGGFAPQKATKQKRYICSLVNPLFRRFPPYLRLPSRIIPSHTKNLTGVPKTPREGIKRCCGGLWILMQVLNIGKMGIAFLRRYNTQVLQIWIIGIAF